MSHIEIDRRRARCSSPIAKDFRGTGRGPGNRCSGTDTGHQSVRLHVARLRRLQSRAMNALRHFLLRGGVATRLLWGLLLAVLLSRALISGAVMLDPDGPDAGAVVLCSGHGPLVLGAAALAARFDADAPITPANDAAALASRLAHHDHEGAGDSSSAAGNPGDICPFAIALFTALASCLLLVLLFPFSIARAAWPRPVTRQALRPTIGDRPPSRAPPLFA
ncbi:hypothetical protein [Burkholderia gladioli]|uniref:hypothetical protein n=2 Tax=Burkholderia gladioli TaxID=28095 RepID=UPI0039BFC273